MMSQKELFEKFLEKFTKIRGSKVLSKAKGKEIADFLKEELANDDAHFKYRVKNRGFQLMDYPTLGLKDISYLSSIQESIARSYYTITEKPFTSK